MMRRVHIVVLLLTLICSGCNLPGTSSAVPDSATQSNSAPTAILNPNTPPPTQILPTASAANPTTFPDSNAFTWQVIVSHLQRPVDLQADGSGRLFVIEKLGRIRIIQDGQLLPDAFLDITDRVNGSGNEMGLLGLAFNPNFSQNGYFYVNYTGPGLDTHISRFQATSDHADAATEVNLLGITQPFPNHNGGSLAFERTEYKNPAGENSQD